MSAAKGMHLISLRVRVSELCTDYLETLAELRRRTRQDEAGLYLDRWVQKGQRRPLPLPEPWTAEPTDIEIRASVEPSTREHLHRLAKEHNTTVASLGGLLLEEWARRQEPAWRRRVRRRRRAG